MTSMTFFSEPDAFNTSLLESLACIVYTMKCQEQQYIPPYFENVREKD